MGRVRRPKNVNSLKLPSRNRNTQRAQEEEEEEAGEGKVEAKKRRKNAEKICTEIVAQGSD